ncbi:MAG: signal peptidase I [Candidatus Aenigmatarchaeota archaeon]|nr:signal peptidase I [Candidatus Aenigmarchaeota archaeon]
MKISLKILTDTWWGNVLLGFLAAVIFYYVILSTVLGNNTPVVAVVSNSMLHDASVEQDYYQWLEKNYGYNRTYISSWPIPNGFSVGDMPIVKKQDKYQVGDVIVYSVEGIRAPIIHRIIKINDDGTYQTKGDNNSGQLSYEFSIKPEQIKGKVIFIIPKIGYFKVVVNRIFGV